MYNAATDPAIRFTYADKPSMNEKPTPVNGGDAFQGSALEEIVFSGKDCRLSTVS
jgi:hypothetical protein